MATNYTVIMETIIRSMTKLFRRQQGRVEKQQSNRRRANVPEERFYETQLEETGINLSLIAIY